MWALSGLILACLHPHGFTGACGHAALSLSRCPESPEKHLLYTFNSEKICPAGAAAGDSVRAYTRIKRAYIKPHVLDLNIVTLK